MQILIIFLFFLDLDILSKSDFISESGVLSFIFNRTSLRIYALILRLGIFLRIINQSLFEFVDERDFQVVSVGVILRQLHGGIFMAHTQSHTVKEYCALL